MGGTLWADRHSQTKCLHRGARHERVSYTPTGRWWSFHTQMGNWSRCLTWWLG